MRSCFLLDIFCFKIWLPPLSSPIHHQPSTNFPPPVLSLRASHIVVWIDFSELNWVRGLVNMWYQHPLWVFTLLEKWDPVFCWHIFHFKIWLPPLSSPIHDQSSTNFLLLSPPQNEFPDYGLSISSPWHFPLPLLFPLFLLLNLLMSLVSVYFVDCCFTWAGEKGMASWFELIGVC